MSDNRSTLHGTIRLAFVLAAVVLCFYFMSSCGRQDILAFHEKEKAFIQSGFVKNRDGQWVKP